VAVVTLRDGSSVSAEEIIAYCRERLAYKYPREICFMAELPKGPSGKILKATLRDA
jgi:long-chain acyl-CoA synthetase